ncbi:LysE family transporter [Ferrimonas marina]|uniref:Threonine/homoserine/homoserine lactone efflux protein n=1 Tax=Ferrimonas marina TaxID=299255 RepID=A0A1M5X144_9GAMM|nr:LysE family transporter [Ferrimonas marina]SHH93342.1 Threonine/homoserine/homoserine lactone efflux protein [Ferrimonas marina]
MSPIPLHELSLLSSLALIHLVALASPGPDFALVVQNASRHGRRIGLAIAMGISLAILLHAILAITGVSLLIRQIPALATGLQIAGGSYLLYLGYGALRGAWLSWHAGAQRSAAKAEEFTHWAAALLKGFTTNLLNPKALVFFLSLITSLIPATMSVTGKGAAIVLLWGLSLGYFALLAWLLTGQRMQRWVMKVAPLIDALCGGLFVLVGGGILLSALLSMGA